MIELIKSKVESSELSTEEIKSIKEPLLKEIRINFDYFTPYKKQKLFYDLTAISRQVTLFGGNRGGKTYCGEMLDAFHATGNYPDDFEGYKHEHPVIMWICGVSYAVVTNTLEKDLFYGSGDTPPIIHPDLVRYGNSIKKYYEIYNSYGGISEITFKAYTEGREKFQAKKLDHLHMDEEPPFPIYNESIMRMVPTGPKHQTTVIITSTCLYKSEFALKFIEKTIEQDGKKISLVADEGEVHDNKAYVLMGWDDSPHLTEDVKKEFKANIPPHELEARTTGWPSSGSGMVYPVSEHIYICPYFEIPEHWAFVNGIDFGWEDPTAVIFITYDRMNDRAYVYNEYKIKHKTPEQHIYGIANRYNTEAFKWAPTKHDPAGNQSSQKDGEKLVEIYKKNGIKMHKADNAKEASIMNILTRMNEGRLFIMENCVDLRKEIRSLSRDEKGKIKDGNDHLHDALRYAIERIGKFARNRSETYSDMNGGFYSSSALF